MEIKIRDLYKIIQERDMGNYSNKSFEELNEAFSKLEKEVQEISTAFKEKDNELKEKDKELQAKTNEIKSLSNLVDYYKHSSVQSNYGGTAYKRSYFNFGLSDKWHSLTNWFGEKKESVKDWFKEYGPLSVLGSATLAGVIGSSIYFHFSEYVASVGIGAAVSSLFCATAGVIADKIKCTEYETTAICAIGGAILGAISGPVSYGYINYLENIGEISFFNNMSGAADVFAKSAIGGVAGPLAALIIIGFLASKK